MSTGIVKILNRDCDLKRTAEYWESESYESRYKKVVRSFEDVRGNTPSKNLRPISEIVFKVTERVTFNSLVGVLKNIDKVCGIHCFQCCIDRENSVAHILYDSVNHDDAKKIRLQNNHIMALSVLFARELGIELPDDEDYTRYFLTVAYNSNKDVFDNVLEELKHAKLTKKNYTTVHDVIAYVKQMCEGNFKNM